MSAPAMARLSVAPGRRDGMDEALIRRLREIAKVREHEPLARHTTFGIGGPADVFVTVTDAAQLAAVVLAARQASAPAFILGAGSNVLVGDAGIRGVVIDNQAKHTRTEPLHIGPESAIAVPPIISTPGDGEAFVVWAESGTPFASLARNLAKQGYTGIEWACGIPGTLGGAAVYNAGAYGQSLSDVLVAVTLIDGDGEQRYLPAADLRLEYRMSAILRGEFGDCAVLSLELAVLRGDATTATARIAELDRQRLDAQPRGRNSGSTFKNPAGHHAWELIDAVGLRGHRIGDALFSNKHCNFIENVGAARAADVAALMREAQQRVRERYGIELEAEVRFVGEGFE